jgi:hypothetical protein
MENNQPVESGEVKTSIEEQVIPGSKTPSKKPSIILTSLFLAVLVLGFGVGLGIFIAPYIKSVSLPSNKTISNEVVKPYYKLAGEVVLLEGVAEKKSGDNWVALKLGDKINERDVLQTGDDSKLVVILDDGSAVRLDKNTQITLSTLSDQVILISQAHGRVYHRVQKGQLVYNVRSLDTLATALGTSFSVKTDEETKNTEVAVFESKVQVTVTGEDVSTETAESGEKIVVDDSVIALSELSQEEKTDEFVKWNETLDEKDITPTLTPIPTAQVTTVVPSGLKLSASAGSGKASLSWTYSGDAPSGFKIMRSLSANPTYPLRESDDFKYLESSSVRSYTWAGLEGGKTYHFRVGVYDGEGNITLYSNDVSVTPLSSENSGYATSVSLQAVSNEAGKVHLTWTIAGGEATYGFKLTRSLNSNPEYPPREGDTWFYYDDETARSYDWDGFASGSTYHIRVGIYDGQGKVIRYSADVPVTVK